MNKIPQAAPTSEVVHNAAQGRFEIRLEDGSVAFADYRREQGKLIFPHTVVPPAHEGQGLASALAAASLKWAREQKLTVVPACSFYQTYMKRHPETQDLLSENPSHRQS